MGAGETPPAGRSFLPPCEGWRWAGCAGWRWNPPCEGWRCGRVRAGWWWWWGSGARGHYAGCVNDPRDIDITNLPRFLTHLAERDPRAAALAKRLLDDGWEVIVFWGPQQMDVWNLQVRKSRVVVAFGVERGFSDGVFVGREQVRHHNLEEKWPIGLLTVAWAHDTGVAYGEPSWSESWSAPLEPALAALAWYEEKLHFPGLGRAWKRLIELRDDAPNRYANPSQEEIAAFDDFMRVELAKALRG